MPNYREYTIKRPDYSDTLKIQVYKTEKSMMKAKGDYKPCTAIFQTTKGIDCDSEGFFTSSMYGIIALNEQNMDIQNIAHECIHAAFAWDRRINRYTGNHEDHDIEERFAGYYEWLLVEVLIILKKAGYKI
jgi:hypothetical protein